MMFFDTHSHFDDPIFDHDRSSLIRQAINIGVRQMIMTGITTQTFERMLKVQAEIYHDTLIKNHNFFSHLAFGLHPFFINHHQDSDLDLLESYIKKHNTIAIGEVGLDTFTPEMKLTKNYDRQKYFFKNQLDLAVKYELPLLLHIRKAHSESLKLIKNHVYNAHELGGIAHSFSGGEQEANAFVKMGFKLGITGQVCNPNAKKLHKSIKSSVAKFGLECLVVETDCPDMTPLHCQTNSNSHSTIHRNTPANLIYVVDALSKLLTIDKQYLSKQLWQNSLDGLKLT